MRYKLTANSLDCSQTTQPMSQSTSSEWFIKTIACSFPIISHVLSSVRTAQVEPDHQSEINTISGSKKKKKKKIWLENCGYHFHQPETYGSTESRGSSSLSSDTMLDLLVWLWTTKLIGKNLLAILRWRS